MANGSNPYAEMVLAGMALCILAACVMGGCVAGCEFSKKSVPESWQVEAVKLGHGEWVVDEKGKTTFRWRGGKSEGEKP